jgi:putative DNA primase/helicase
MGRFINECCSLGTDKHIKAGDLFEAYKQWCEEWGLEANKTSFGKEMKSRFDFYKRRNVFYTGIDLNE